MKTFVVRYKFGESEDTPIEQISLDDFDEDRDDGIKVYEHVSVVDDEEIHTFVQVERYRGVDRGALVTACHKVQVCSVALDSIYLTKAILTGRAADLTEVNADLAKATKEYDDAVDALWHYLCQPVPLEHYVETPIQDSITPIKEDYGLLLDNARESKGDQE